VNINTATKEELMQLKGIGPKKADAIIEYREKNRGFKEPKDITIVKGIGDKMYEMIKNQIITR
jgi:competence protein ComEA